MGILDKIKQYANPLLTIPLGANLFLFMMDVYLAYTDDYWIDQDEYAHLEGLFHQLVTGVSGMDLAILLGAMVFINVRRKR